MKNLIIILIAIFTFTAFSFMSVKRPIPEPENVKGSLYEEDKVPGAFYVTEYPDSLSFAKDTNAYFAWEDTLYNNYGAIYLNCQGKNLQFISLNHHSQIEEIKDIVEILVNKKTKPKEIVHLLYTESLNDGEEQWTTLLLERLGG